MAGHRTLEITTNFICSMKISILHKTIALIAFSVVTISTALSAREIWKAGHIDIRVNYGEEGWIIDLHHEELGSRSTEDVILWVRGGDWSNSLGARWQMPDDNTFSFIGVQAGEPFWMLPNTEASWLVWPGFAVEDTENHWFHSYVESDSRVSDTAAQWVTIDLLEVDFQGVGAGELSMWQPGPNLFWSTHAEPSEGNRYYIFRGAHSHMNWAFSQPGLYTIDIQASALLANDPEERVFSDPVSIQFYVDPYGLWVHEHFTVEAEADGQADLRQDPFDTGIPNALAYAFGHDPRLPLDPTYPQLSVMNEQIAYEFPIRTFLGLGSLVIDHSDDLADWQPIAALTGEKAYETFDPASEIQLLDNDKVRLLLDSIQEDRNFFRLRFEE